MGRHFTKTIRDEQAIAGAVAPAGEPLAVNRAAWPSGPLLARAVVSDRSASIVIYDPVAEAKPRPAADAG